jgi:hypothetical protein
VERNRGGGQGAAGSWELHGFARCPAALSGTAGLSSLAPFQLLPALQASRLRPPPAARRVAQAVLWPRLPAPRARPARSLTSAGAHFCRGAGILLPGAARQHAAQAARGGRVCVPPPMLQLACCTILEKAEDKSEQTKPARRPRLCRRLASWPGCVTRTSCRSWASAPSRPAS